MRPSHPVQEQKEDQGKVVRTGLCLEPRATLAQVHSLLTCWCPTIRKKSGQPPRYPLSCSIMRQTATSVDKVTYVSSCTGQVCRELTRLQNYTSAGEEGAASEESNSKGALLREALCRALGGMTSFIIKGPQHLQDRLL